MSAFGHRKSDNASYVINLKKATGGENKEAEVESKESKN